MHCGIISGKCNICINLNKNPPPQLNCNDRIGIKNDRLPGLANKFISIILGKWISVFKPPTGRIDGEPPPVCDFKLRLKEITLEPIIRTLTGAQ